MEGRKSQITPFLAIVSLQLGDCFLGLALIYSAAFSATETLYLVFSHPLEGLTPPPTPHHFQILLGFYQHIFTWDQSPCMSKRLPPPCCNSLLSPIFLWCPTTVHPTVLKLSPQARSAVLQKSQKVIVTQKTSYSKIWGACLKPRIHI